MVLCLKHEGRQKTSVRSVDTHLYQLEVTFFLIKTQQELSKEKEYDLGITLPKNPAAKTKVQAQREGKMQ